MKRRCGIFAFLCKNVQERAFCAVFRSVWWWVIVKNIAGGKAHKSRWFAVYCCGVCVPVGSGCACNAECAAAVGSMDDGRRTQGVTAVVCAADGRRTMTFCAQRQTLCDKSGNCLHRNAGKKEAITQAGRGRWRSIKEVETEHEGGGIRA